MPKTSQPRHDLRIQRSIEIPTRDGLKLSADVFRPKGNGRFPALINIGAYQKEKLWVPPADLEEKPNPYMNWETVNPLWWTPRGYACVRVDTRGSGKSPGITDPFSLQEALDFYDAIEHVARQPWCNGRVATMGISYFAMTQWLVANLNPPSLKCIIPWEGAADMYRDFAYHGGMFCFGFVTNWYNNHMAHHLLGRREQSAPEAFGQPWLWGFMRHSLDTGWYHGRQARWEDIKVPLYSAGNWSGMGLHLRGNTEGYLRAASKHKKLRIHTGSHYHAFYSNEGRQDQLRFCDHWLKGIDTGIMDEPPVKLLIRKGGRGNEFWRSENEWPLKRTKWTKFYLAPTARKQAKTVEGRLATVAPKMGTSVTYPATITSNAGVASASWSAATVGTLARSGITFETEPMPQDMEVTGPVNLVLWVSSTDEDMDIHATIRNIDADGNDVWEVGQQGQPVAVARGWLRVSHRKLDPKLSKPWRPYLAHDEQQWLKPNEVARVEVEIWPTCMVFAKGHRIRLDIQPRDGVGAPPYTHYHGQYNAGSNTVYAGGARASYLLLPVIPIK